MVLDGVLLAFAVWRNLPDVPLGAYLAP